MLILTVLIVLLVVIRTRYFSSKNDPQHEEVAVTEPVEQDVNEAKEPSTTSDLPEDVVAEEKTESQIEAETWLKEPNERVQPSTLGTVWLSTPKIIKEKPKKTGNYIHKPFDIRS